MFRTPANHYERAFESWLRDSGIRYVAIDQQKRAAFARTTVKSFDMLIYGPGEPAEVFIAEVKGKRFEGDSLEGLAGMQNWVTMDDVRGLKTWEEALGEGYRAVFVFAYDIVKPDVDLDGREAYDFEGRRYVFFCVKLEDYMTWMTVRSPQWRTLMLPAAGWRNCCTDAADVFAPTRT
jgi:hypothetical protein